jgi:hypothetical protein
MVAERGVQCGGEQRWGVWEASFDLLGGDADGAQRLPQFFSFGSATGGSPFLSLREEIPETTYIKGLAGFSRS